MSSRNNLQGFFCLFLQVDILSWIFVLIRSCSRSDSWFGITGVSGFHGVVWAVSVWTGSVCSFAVVVSSMGEGDAVVKTGFFNKSNSTWYESFPNLIEKSFVFGLYSQLFENTSDISGKLDHSLAMLMFRTVTA